MHMLNAFIVVSGLSYGMLCMIENLGPQFVQLMNGYASLRSEASFNSDKHSSQMPMSGDTSADPPADLRLSLIEKSEKP